MLTGTNDSSDLISDYIERIMICGEAGDVSEDGSHRIATEQCGTTFDELAAYQIAYWRQQMKALPEPNDHRLLQFVPFCLSELNECWALNAIRSGWTGADLFGLDRGVPRAYSGNGLVTSIQLTALRRPVRIVNVYGDCAIVETRTGSRLKHHRRTCPGRPIWEHPTFARSWH